MKKLSLRVLLNEVQTTQSDFLLQLINTFQQNPNVKGRIGAFLESQIKKINPDESSLSNILTSYQGKVNKKRRVSIEKQINKSLGQEFKGLDGSPINFKLIKPMYHSILLFLKNSSDSSFDDCILSADYYMKTFYDESSEEEKETIQQGKFNFSIIFERTNFYQNFLNETLGVKKTYLVYEDDIAKVVYSANPDSFNHFIKRKKVTLSWCTQTPSTWFSYNDKHYVMFLMDKRVKNDKSHENYIISLKVSTRTHEVLYSATCDRYNNHMEEHDINNILSPEAESDIKQFIKNNMYTIFMPNSIEIEKAVYYSNEIYKADYISDALKLETLKDLSSNILIDKVTTLIRKSSNYDKYFDETITDVKDEDIESTVRDFKEFLLDLRNLLGEEKFINMFANSLANIFSNFRNDSTFIKSIKILMTDFKDIFLKVITELLEILKKDKHPRYFNFLSLILDLLNRSQEMNYLYNDVLQIINQENFISNITSLALNNSNPINFDKTLNTYFMLTSFQETSKKRIRNSIDGEILSFDAVDEDLIINSKSFISFIKNESKEIFKLGGLYSGSSGNETYKKIISVDSDNSYFNKSLLIKNNKNKISDILFKMSEELPDFSFDGYQIDYDNIFTSIVRLCPYYPSFDKEFKLLEYLKSDETMLISLSDEDVLEIEESIFYDPSVIQKIIKHRDTSHYNHYETFIKMFNSFKYETNSSSISTFKFIIKEFYNYIEKKPSDYVINLLYNIQKSILSLIEVCSKLKIYYKDLDDNAQQNILEVFAVIENFDEFVVNGIKERFGIYFIQSAILNSDSLIDSFSLFVAKKFLGVGKDYKRDVIMLWAYQMLDNNRFRDSLSDHFIELSKDDISSASKLYSTLLDLDAYSNKFFNDRIILKLILLFLELGSNFLPDNNVKNISSLILSAKHSGVLERNSESIISSLNKMNPHYRNLILRYIESIYEDVFNELISLGADDNYQEKSLKKIPNPKSLDNTSNEDLSNQNKNQKINLNRESKLLKDYIKLILN